MSSDALLVERVLSSDTACLFKVIHSKDVKTVTSVLAVLREKRTRNRQNSLINQGFVKRK